MKRKTILAHPASETRKKGEILTTQLIGNILVLNYWKDRVLQGRYCMNTATGEYEYWDAERNVWRQARLNTMVEHDPWCYRSINLTVWRMSRERRMRLHLRPNGRNLIYFAESMTGSQITVNRLEITAE